jgi:hypothetical protein
MPVDETGCFDESVVGLGLIPNGDDFIGRHIFKSNDDLIEMMGDLPPVKIVGVIPYVIGEDSTFSMTDEVVKASETMQKVIIDYIKSFGIDVKVKNPDIKITDVTVTTYIKGVTYDIGV